MKKFSEILSNDFYKLNNILKENNNYFAHRKDNPLRRELLSQHTDLTLQYFQDLVYANKLEKIIDLQIVEFVKAQGFNDERIFLFVKESFVNTIYFHDFGKINENFQKKKMLSDNFQEIENGIGTKHSILSTFLYLSYQNHLIINSTFNSRTKNFLYYVTAIFVHSTTQHHSKLSNPNTLQFDLIKQDILSHYTAKFDSFNNFDIELLLKFIRNNFQNILNIARALENSFLSFSLVKLNSSLLTAADYYATNEFMLGIKVNDFGILDEKLRYKINKNIKSVSYNYNLYEKFNHYNSLNIKRLKKRNNKNLNLLRQSLSANMIAELRKSFNKKLFYLEAPTGAGKTNLSLLFLAELLIKKKNEISKVFYVFPFTTLITQTFNSLKENLRLNQNEIVEVHSRASFNKTNDDSNYGEDKLNYIDSLFINFPISLISHITFFDILTSTSKEKTYLLHRLANSVVIIDEIQSYSPTEWDKINYLIKNYSEYYNITVLIMSATLPKISKLLIENKVEDSFVYLIKDRDEYFRNPNFSERVEVDTTLLLESYSQEKLQQKVIEASENFANEHHFVKTIVEFITKKRAFEFYSHLTTSNQFSEYKIFLISGTILEPRRREIIDYLKKLDGNGKTIVISTQVIEAGVDIDMDIGFKDKSIIDSEEQIAGRINRNARKSNSKLFLFDTGDAQNVYRTDLRYKLHLQNDEYIKILVRKEFELYYQLVFNRINKDNQNEYIAKTLTEFKSYVKANDYSAVSNSFELIKNNTVSIFVPLKIKTKYFSKGEIEFINNFLSEKIGNFVDGYKVWNIYEDLIKNKIEDFILKKVNLKIISSILSKFSFSIWKNQNELRVLSHYSLDGAEKYGFLMLYNYKDIYSYEAGLISNIYENINFIGF